MTLRMKTLKLVCVYVDCVNNNLVNHTLFQPRKTQSQASAKTV